MKLPDFCDGCGRLGHVLKNCDGGVLVEGDGELQYGAWLRASPLKSRRRNAETEILEEIRLFLALKSKGGHDVKTKLVFENNCLAGQRGGGSGSGQPSHDMNMHIDNNAMVIPAGDVFKRKLDKGRQASAAEKVRVLRDVAMGGTSTKQKAEVISWPCQGQ